MLRASVPEASIDKDSGFLTNKHNVRRTRQVLAVKSEAKALHVERPTQESLWLSVLPADTAHIESSLFGGKDVRHATLCNLVGLACGHIRGDRA